MTPPWDTYDYGIIRNIFVNTLFAPIITFFLAFKLPMSFAPGPIKTKSPTDGAPKYSPIVTPGG